MLLFVVACIQEAAYRLDDDHVVVCVRGVVRRSMRIRISKRCLLDVRLVFVAIVSVLLSGAADIARADALPATVKLGAVLPLSGDAQVFGTEARVALEHAIADAAPKKFRYQLLLEDDQLSASRAATAAQKLTSNDKVSVIFSNWSYGGHAVASIVSGRPTINISFAWDNKIPERSPNNFLSAPPPNRLAEALVMRLKERGVQTIALLGFEEAGVLRSFDVVESVAKREGIKVIGRAHIPTTSQGEIRPLVGKLKSAAPDYLVTCFIYPQYLELFRTLRALKMQLSIASIGQVSYSKDFAELAPSTWWSVDFLASPEKELEIQRRTGLVDLTGYAAYYDAARAVIAVVESAPGNTIPSSEWISDALQQYRTSDTLLGEFYFENRIRQSNNMRIVDQSGRYASR